MKEGRHTVERLILKIYRLIGDYGENYKKLFFCMIASIGLSSLAIQVIEKKSFFLKGWDFSYLKTVFFGIIPMAIQRTVIEDIEKLSTASKFILTIEGLTAITLFTLFVMAVRRQFRR